MWRVYGSFQAGRCCVPAPPPEPHQSLAWDHQQPTHIGGQVGRWAARGYDYHRDSAARDRDGREE
ncbi:hypothetical protein E2C01_059331 [Portunus trituberculatus]|uniref:Uncharacterized protein n=1 Tax=Portunus trituberculatus TaxID=210409 RepID=A0A5B7GYU8_PORTR|nr:hypothetical protein [Portunus trituberculatus]